MTLLPEVELLHPTRIAVTKNSKKCLLQGVFQKAIFYAIGAQKITIFMVFDLKSKQLSMIFVLFLLLIQ